MINTPVKQRLRSNRQLSPGLQFLIFTCIFIGIFIVFNIIGFAIASAVYGTDTINQIRLLNLSAPHVVRALWLMQLVGTTLSVFVAPVFYAYVIANEPVAYLKPRFSFSWQMMLLIFVIMFVSNPLIEFLSNLNQQIPLPKWLSWMKENEESDRKVMDAFLHMKNVWDVIVDVLAIGLLTAIVEEFMFRGVMLTIFTRWTKSTHAAVWITAIMFSAFHMEFFGFLPRLLLGAFMGYFVAWSGSIWTGVWAHFVNNATIVVVTYLYQIKVIKTDPDNQHVFNGWQYVVALVITLALMILYHRWALKKAPEPDYDGEELD